jgi:hypothetical protein
MEFDADAVRTVWLVSLGVFLVVLVVVALLLTLILRTAKSIRGGVSEIWNVGQKVANNTIHISLLDSTNHIVSEILGNAAKVAAATGAIAAHARQCPHCPSCVLEPGPAR